MPICLEPPEESLLNRYFQDEPPSQTRQLHQRIRVITLTRDGTFNGIFTVRSHLFGCKMPILFHPFEKFVGLQDQLVHVQSCEDEFWQESSIANIATMAAPKRC
jgi:hypothetical protein